MKTEAIMKKKPIAIALLITSFLAVGIVSAQRAAAPDRAKAQKLMNEGNWKEAYEQYGKLALDPATDPKFVGQDLTQAIQSLSE